NICPSGARKFGDINDPESEVAKLVEEFNLTAKSEETTLLPGEKTSPRNYYIDPDNVLKTKMATKKYEGNESYRCKVG
ncbi:MAG: hypothetical protein GY859_13570, partial [Desulfobacterales bacterium]|nr:hypothetical protein [Desulfobacterales bacterium]